MTGLAEAYTSRRDLLLEILERHGFTCHRPSGAYYVMTDITSFGFQDDVAFAKYLIQEVGVAAVPGSGFYDDPDACRTKVRFCFCKQFETMREADARMSARLKVQSAG